jgi:DNA-binding response OmpR family regulator
MRVLVVEDEVRMVRLLARALREEGRGADGTEGLLLGALGEDL